MSSYYKNIALTFSGDVLFPTALAGAAMFFGYRYITKYQMYQSKEADPTPCETAWQSWATTYLSLIQSTTEPTEQNFIDNSAGLMKQLATYPQCLPSTYKESPGLIFNAISTEAGSKAVANTNCYYKAPSTWMNNTPCQLFNYNGSGGVVDACAGVPINSLVPTNSGIPSASCVVTDIPENGNSAGDGVWNSYYAGGNFNTTVGVCQYSNDILQSNFNSLTKDKDFTNWITTPGHEYTAAMSSANGLTTLYGTLPNWWPILVQTSNNPPPGYEANTDSIAGFMMGDYMKNGTTLTGLVHGYRDHPCFVDANCQSNSCPYSVKNGNGVTRGYANLFPPYSNSTWEAYDGNYLYEINGNTQADGNKYVGVMMSSCN